MRKQRAKQQSRDIWYKWVEQWQTSGLSQAEFCRLHKLHSGNFYNWSAKYRHRHKALQANNPARTLIPVEFTPEPRGVSLSCGEIHIHFDQGLGVEQAIAWINALRTGVC